MIAFYWPTMYAKQVRSTQKVKIRSIYVFVFQKWLILALLRMAGRNILNFCFNISRAGSLFFYYWPSCIVDFLEHLRFCLE